jgi:hypothetical protein
MDQPREGVFKERLTLAIILFASELMSERPESGYLVGLT